MDMHVKHRIGTVWPSGVIQLHNLHHTRQVPHPPIVTWLFSLQRLAGCTTWRWKHDGRHCRVGKTQMRYAYTLTGCRTMDDGPGGDRGQPSCLPLTWFDSAAEPRLICLRACIARACGENRMPACEFEENNLWPCLEFHHHEAKNCSSWCGTFDE